MNEFLQGSITILSLVNPLICAAIFGGITRGKSWNDKLVAATRAVIAIAIILCLAAIAGAQVLQVFGISLPAFQVAGGMVLVWMGFIMLRGNSSPTTSETDRNEGDVNGSADGSGEAAEGKPVEDKEPVSLTPLVLFAASPGTITGVITLAVSHSQDAIPVTALVSVIVALIITWLVILGTARGSGNDHDNKPSLVHDVTGRFMGLIVLAMGVQFALAGLQQFFDIPDV